MDPVYNNQRGQITNIAKILWLNFNVDKLSSKRPRYL